MKSRYFLTPEDRSLTASRSSNRAEVYLALGMSAFPENSLFISQIHWNELFPWDSRMKPEKGAWLDCLCGNSRTAELPEPVLGPLDFCHFFCQTENRHPLIQVLFNLPNSRRCLSSQSLSCSDEMAWCLEFPLNHTRKHFKWFSKMKYNNDNYRSWVMIMWIVITLFYLLLKFEIFHIKNVLESVCCVSCNCFMYMSCFEYQLSRALRSGPKFPTAFISSLRLNSMMQKYPLNFSKPVGWILEVPTKSEVRD